MNPTRLSALAPGCSILATALVLVGCASAQRPSDRPASAPAATGGVDASVDAGLGALVSQGRSLADHVGPDAARAIFDDLDRRPGLYLDRIEARFVTPTPAPGFDSLLLSVPLWSLRRHDDVRVRRIAERLVAHYRALAQRTPPTNDPGFAERLAERAAAMELLRDGVDVVAGPRWQLVPASELRVGDPCAPDASSVLRVTRGCTCGQPLSCRARVVDGALRVEVRTDPDTLGVCTDCYPVSTACTLPAGAPATMFVNDVARTVSG